MLSDADRAIAALDRLIAKKRDIKQATMQQLLTGKTRLPGFSGEWEESTVGQEFDVRLGKMIDAEKNRGVSKPYLANRDVEWGRIDTNSLQKVKMTSQDLKEYRLKFGDLIVCEGSEIGRCAIWQDQIEECYYQKALHRLRPKIDYSVDFMAALLKIWSDSKKFRDYVTQTSIAHLTKEKFITMPLIKPDVYEQKAIAQILTDIDTEIETLEKKCDKYKQIKQGMMQELLTGQTRLIDPKP